MVKYLRGKYNTKLPLVSKRNNRFPLASILLSLNESLAYVKDTDNDSFVTRVDLMSFHYPIAGLNIAQKEFKKYLEELPFVISDGKRNIRYSIDTLALGRLFFDIIFCETNDIEYYLEHNVFSKSKLARKHPTLQYELLGKLIRIYLHNTYILFKRMKEEKLNSEEDSLIYDVRLHKGSLYHSREITLKSLARGFFLSIPLMRREYLKKIKTAKQYDKYSTEIKDFFKELDYYSELIASLTDTAFFLSRAISNSWKSKHSHSWGISFSKL